MGVLTIRNVDDEVIARLKARAKRNHRSLEGELRHLLSRYAVPDLSYELMRERARAALSKPESTVALSPVSIWERCFSRRRARSNSLPIPGGGSARPSRPGRCGSSP